MTSSINLMDVAFLIENGSRIHWQRDRFNGISFRWKGPHEIEKLFEHMWAIYIQYLFWARDFFPFKSFPPSHTSNNIYQIYIYIYIKKIPITTTGIWEIHTVPCSASTSGLVSGSSSSHTREWSLHTTGDRHGILGLVNYRSPCGKWKIPKLNYR